MSERKCPFHHKVMEAEHIKTRGLIRYHCTEAGCSVVLEVPDTFKEERREEDEVL